MDALEHALGEHMAVNTAGQGASAHAAYGNAQHPVQTERSSPQSGGDSYGKFAGVSGHNVPTSGGRADSRQGTLDRNKDQAGKGLYLGKAFENAQHPKGVKTKGNSVGKQELLDNHHTDTVSKAAKARISKSDEASRRLVQAAAKKPFAGVPFRKSSPAFGPFGKSAPVHEHEMARKF